jgi:hypothetical protein
MEMARQSTYTLQQSVLVSLDVLNWEKLLLL